MLRTILAVVLPALFLAACLPDPKHGCRTRDDCASGRVCVVGICQPERRDAGLDAGADKQPSRDGVIESWEMPSSDLAGGSDGSHDDVLPDAPTTIYAPDGPAGLHDDVLPDAPATIHAPDGPAGLDASSDEQSSGDVAIDFPERLSPDLAIDLDRAPDLAAVAVDATPDNSAGAGIDAPPASDLPQGGTDASDAEPNGADALAPCPVSWEDFRAQSPREPWTGGRYIVDGDIALDEAGLRRYYDAWFAAAGVSSENLAPMGAGVVWPSPDCFFLSYCISTDFGDNLAAVEGAMQTATASWSDRVGVQYTYLAAENASCNADNINVTFDVRPVFSAGYTAVSFFPDSPRSARSLLLDTSAFAVGPGGVALEAILRHQLGHTLGFQHEHLWLDPACTRQDSCLAVQIANYDVDSVMHLPACRPSEIGGTIESEGDLVGAMAIYGLSPALTCAIEIL